jgi:hypothetical protein
MVVRFISQTLSFSKEVLSALVQRHVKKIFAQTTQSREGIKLLFAQSSKLIFLGGVHITYSRDKSYFTAKSIIGTALDLENKEVAIAPSFLLARFSSPYLEARGIQTTH